MSRWQDKPDSEGFWWVCWWNGKKSTVSLADVYKDGRVFWKCEILGMVGCRTIGDPTLKDAKWMKTTAPTPYCDKCGGKGYSRRMVAYELYENEECECRNSLR